MENSIKWILVALVILASAWGVGAGRDAQQAADRERAMDRDGKLLRASYSPLHFKPAIDTATEMLAYYPVQVEKILPRREPMLADRGDEELVATLGTALLGEPIRAGDPLLLDPRSNVALEKLPKEEVEEAAPAPVIAAAPAEKKAKKTEKQNKK